MDLPLKFINEDGEQCIDLLYSEKYVKEFNTIVKNSYYSVYAVSGGWGTGKTTFIQMWENLLNENEQAFVHIDAFKMDYESDPFIMLIKAFKTHIEKFDIDKNNKEKWLDKAKNIFTISNMVKLGINVLVDKTIGTEPIKEFIGKAYETYFDKLTEDGSLYDDLKDSLEKILENNKSLYIIIDELDRCRPDFALETLERIKHIFHVKNVKYILVYNEKIMKKIINIKYGININTDRYLHKFVQKTYFLNNTRRLKQWFIKEVENSKEEYSFIMYEFLTNNSTAILTIAKMYELKLRDIQQLLSQLSQYNYNNYDDLFTMILSTEFLKLINKDEYENLINYYYEYSNIAVNTPTRVTLINIFKSIKEKAPLLPGSNQDIYEPFYKYMEYCENRYL